MAAAGRPRMAHLSEDGADDPPEPAMLAAATRRGVDQGRSSGPGPRKRKVPVVTPQPPRTPGQSSAPSAPPPAALGCGTVPGGTALGSAKVCHLTDAGRPAGLVGKGAREGKRPTTIQY